MHINLSTPQIRLENLINQLFLLDSEYNDDDYRPALEDAERAAYEDFYSKKQTDDSDNEQTFLS